MPVDNHAYLIDNIPFLPPLSINTTAPTTGTKAQETQLCDDQIDQMQGLAGEAQAAHTKFLSDLLVVEENNNKLSIIAPKIFAFNRTKIESARSSAAVLLREVIDVCDIAQKDKLRPSHLASAFTDLSIASIAFSKFTITMAAIANRGLVIKLASIRDRQTTQVTNSIAGLQQLDKLPMAKYKYNIELYMIPPGGKRIRLDQYINELLYTRLFDHSSLPIYSILFKLPQTVVNQIKMHNEKIQWFISVSMSEISYEKSNNLFSLTRYLIKDSQLIPVDPVFNMPQPDKDGVTSGVPIYPLKIDLVPHKDTVLNSKMKSRVFKNVKMLDVITTLAAELKAEYAKRQEPTSREVRFSISPPDNIGVYEQVLVEPGSFSKVIYQLQTKYGIYNTGVRVSFDSIKTNGSDINYTQVTVLGKGDIAPSEDSLKSCIIELVDPKVIDSSKLGQPAYDSGQFMDSNTGTTVLRSFLPYIVSRRNSEALTKGESVRVMNSSVDDHLTSNCDDNVTGDIGMQKIYWSKYNNPYALTQLQDSIREKSLIIQAQFRDLNILALSDNQNYMLKFFGEDDGVYSGEYRLSEVRWFYRAGNVKSISDIETDAVMTFTNIPKLRVNGTEVERASYGEKLNNNLTAGGGASGGSGYSSQSNLSPAKVSSGKPSNSKSPYPTNFAGKKDFYGKTIPNGIPDSWQMSPRVTLKHTYDLKDGSDSRKAAGLCKSFSHFINAQRFAKEIIEPCLNMFGSLGTGGKANSWYRYSIPGGGSKTSQHLIALAIDSTWGGATGDALCEKFFKLMKSGLEFDQIILEGNGSQWRWIHIGKQMNGTNRKQVKIALNAIQGQYKNVRVDKVQSPADLNYSVIRKVCY